MHDKFGRIIFIGFARTSSGKSLLSLESYTASAMNIAMRYLPRRLVILARKRTLRSLVFKDENGCAIVLIIPVDTWSDIVPIIRQHCNHFVCDTNIN